MFRLVLVVVGCAHAILAAELKSDQKCINLFHPKNFGCCKTDEKKHLMVKDDDIKECHRLQSRPPACDVDICVAKKRGFASDDGTIDVAGLRTEIETRFADKPDLKEAVLARCVGGDLSPFAPPDFCDLVKLRHCIGVQMMALCPEWEDEGKCSGFKELVNDCITK